MSKWKLTKLEIKQLNKLTLNELLLEYEDRVAQMLTQISKIVEYSSSTKLPLTQRSLYILRQMSVNVDHFSLVYRRKSIEFMRQEREKKEGKQ